MFLLGLTELNFAFDELKTVTSQAPMLAFPKFLRGLFSKCRKVIPFVILVKKFVIVSYKL